MYKTKATLVTMPFLRSDLSPTFIGNLNVFQNVLNYLMQEKIVNKLYYSFYCIMSGKIQNSYHLNHCTAGKFFLLIPQQNDRAKVKYLCIEFQELLQFLLVQTRKIQGQFRSWIPSTMKIPKKNILIEELLKTQFS